MVAGLVAALVLGLPGSAAGEHVYLLGGPRQVRATVRAGAKGYEVRVRMLAVGCFDRATNQEVNRQMARSYALQGLARHLAGKPSVELSVSGARVTDSGPEGKFFALSLAVPRDGVEVVTTPKASSHPGADLTPAGDRPGPERAAAPRSLFGRKEQYEQTLAGLEAVGSKRLRDLGRKGAEAGSEAEEFASGVARLRKEFDANARQLGDEVRADVELFSLGSDLDPAHKSEKDELLDRVAAARERFREQCEAAVKKYRPVPRERNEP